MSESDTLAATEPGEPLEGDPPPRGPGTNREGTRPGRRAPTAALGGSLGRYVIVGKLGQGGMGTVLKAYDESLDRAIAIKLMHSEMAERHARRLTREAQALAKLSHPNVVQVYEVSKADGHWFIAMELIRGQTLRQWQQDEHEWRECVTVYAQAGAGLAAAHAVGLVHRDFKPDNCIIDDAGRPRVLDFGIVRGAELPSDSESGEPSEESDMGPVGADDVPLTRDGAVLGTLAYMPLEQLEGRPADARSDQFSFCVSLYEALYGERPFDDGTMGGSTLALMNDEVRPPPRGTHVPGKLRRLLLRGLSADPEKRWPTLDALLEQLHHTANPPRRVGYSALVVGGGLAALGLGLWARQADVEPPCRGAQEKLEGVWDQERRQQVADAILGTELSYAKDTWARVEPMLDRYAAAWVDSHTQICEATSVRKEQSTAVMDLRMACLQRRQVELREAVDVLAEANETRVAKAVNLVSGLGRLSRCDDIEALQADVPPPDDPLVADRVERVREQLAHANSLQDAGEYSSAMEEAEVVLQQADELGYAPLQAESYYRRGSIHQDSGRFPEAERDLERAYLLAAEHGHSTVETEAVAMLTWVVGLDQAHPERGLQWGMTALARSKWLRGDRLAEARSMHAIGNVLSSQSRLDEALEHLQGALALRQEALGTRSPSVASSLGSIGDVLQKQGKLDQALQHLERALAIQRDLLGPSHPHVAPSLDSIGIVLFKQGKVDEALARMQRALSIREDALGPRHPKLAKSLGNTGILLAIHGKLDEALEYDRRALAILEDTQGARHPDVATLRHSIANVLTSQGKLEEALAEHQRALAIFEDTLGTAHPSYARSLYSMAEVLQKQGKLQDALVHHQRALSISEEALGDGHPNVAMSLAALARLALALDDVDAARRHAERAMKIRESSEVSPAQLAEARFLLARALWSEASERSRSLALAGQARDAYAELGDSDKNESVENWLRRRRQRP